MGWVAIAGEFARGFWASVPGYVQWLLVAWLVLRAAEPVAELAVSRKRLASDPRPRPREAGRKRPSPKPEPAAPMPVEAGLAEIGGQARPVRWDGTHYSLDGVRGVMAADVLAQLFSRHAGRLHTTTDPTRPGVLAELPVGADSVLPACGDCGGRLQMLPSATVPGTWLARCETGTHDRPLSREEEGLLARLTGLRLRAGVLEAPDGDHDILWDGKEYRVAGVPGALPPSGLAGLAARPQVRLFGDHEKAGREGP